MRRAEDDTRGEPAPGPVERVSAIVVTHDSSGALRATLEALAAQLLPADELIVVDNASSDGTPALAAGYAPGAIVIANDENTGFAAGANTGAAHATGELLLFLNPDAVPRRGFAEAIRRPLRAGRGWSAWMGLVTLEDGRLVNTSGGVVHFTGIAWAGQMGAPVAAAPREPREVAFASGACLALPREVWLRSGGFAEPFFMYCEDVELSLRLRLWGGRVGLEPAAKVDHGYEFHKGELKWRLLERNRWSTLIRTYPAPLLLLIAPALAAAEVAVTLAAMRGGWGRQKALAALDTARALPRLLRERREIQRRRRATSGEFAAWLTADLSSPYLGPAARSAAVRRGLGAYWSAVRALLGGR